MIRVLHFLRRILPLSHCLKWTGSFFSRFPLLLFIYIHPLLYLRLRRVSCLRIDFIVSCFIFSNTLMFLFLTMLALFLTC